MNRQWKSAKWAVLIGLALAGCAPPEPAVESRTAHTGEQATRIRLSDDLLCRWELDTSPDGPYACGSRDGSEVRLAAPPLVTGTTLRATLAMRSPAGRLRRRALVGEIEEVVLAGGSVCHRADLDEAAAPEGRRLEFTCRAAAFDGLVGSLQPEGERFVATAVRIERHAEGPRLVRVGRVPVAIIGLAPGGMLSQTLSIRAGGGLISRRS